MPGRTAITLVGFVSSAQVAPSPPRRIQLPRTSTRLQKPHVYTRILTGIRPDSWGAVSFEGPICSPGQVVDFAGLPQPLVVIECAGPLGTYRAKQRRDYLYLLWAWDHYLNDWREVARAQAKDHSWTSTLREPAIRALHPRPELVDILDRSVGLAEEIIESIDRKLCPELPDVRKTVLSEVYERVAGRIVACA